MLRNIVVSVGVIFLASAGVGWSQKIGEPHIGEMHLQALPPIHYLYATLETDFKSMGEPIGKTLGNMFKTAEERKIMVRGGVVNIYFNSPHLNPEKPFKMETGFPVAEGTVAPLDYKVRKTPNFKCATMLYIGPVARLGEAWQKLVGAVSKAGLTPTGEEREVTLFWEGLDSANNIVQIQMGVK